MVAIDEVLGTFGIDAILGEQTDRYPGVQAVYCVTGDGSTPTVLRCNRSRRFLIASRGEYVDTNSL